MPDSVWCVLGSGGYCATADGKKPSDSAWNVDTLCEHVIVLPGGSRKLHPTCRDCRAALAAGSAPESGATP